MCFFHAPVGDEITRGDAILRLAALSTLPILPTVSRSPSPREANAGRQFTAILGTTALVGDDLTPMPNATILIRQNTIDAVGPAAAVDIPESAYRIDGANTYAIPGLIDSHVHFFQSGGLYTRPDAIDLRSVRPYTDELQWIRDNIEDTFARYLRAGITSVVDVGGPFWNYDVRAQARASAAAPRVMAAGPLISSVERAILDPYGDPPIVKIDTVEAARALVDRELAKRTDYVKFWWIVAPEHPASAFQPVARAAIEYAHSKDTRVVIHATELETARLAVESGTDILAHSVFDTDVDDEFVEMLKTRNVIYCPTLIVVGNYGYTFAGKPNLTAVDLRIANPDAVGTLFNMKDVEAALPPERLARIRALRVPEPPHAAMRNLKRVHDAGITIAAGTDAGNIGTQHASSFYDEALEMVASGLSPKDVLSTATKGGAAMMGRRDIGTIERGKLADIVLLKENPLDNIAGIASVERTIKDGRVYDAAAILRETPAQIVQHHVNAFNHHDADLLAESYAGSQRAAFETTYRELFAKNPDIHAEIVNRRVDGETVIDTMRVSGYADGRTVDTKVQYRIRNGEIVRSDVVA
jgi:imidazolonepropionase-like amidohydrolase